MAHFDIEFSDFSRFNFELNKAESKDDKLLNSDTKDLVPGVGAVSTFATSLDPLLPPALIMKMFFLDL